jgi:formate--tetrahydrofolate ligase
MSGGNNNSIIQAAQELGIADNIETYGKQIAKVPITLLEKLKGKKDGRLILVTSTNPTPAGEGKTTTVIGLGQAFKELGKKVIIAIREPSMGPCFGIKGGATGGGKSKVEPSDGINLMFTGDFPAITAAHNLLSALVNNHIYHGNKLGIDVKRIVFPRTIDMNDRSLRQVIVGVGDRNSGIIANDSYVITPASELMAILGLSTSYKDLKDRLSRILVAFTYDGKPVYAKDLNAQGSMAAILKDALKPNIVLTTEGVPAFIHTGPFGNIAHGTSSIIADRMGLKLSDYLITEAGFGSELGAEKFFDIVSHLANLDVSAVVIVTTIRALKHHGENSQGKKEGITDLEAGFPNLLRHVNIVRKFNIEPVVSVNLFTTDTDEEKQKLAQLMELNNLVYAFADFYNQGGKGGLELARKVLDSAGKPLAKITRAYTPDEKVKTKIEKIAKSVYGAKGVEFSDQASKDIRQIDKLGYSNLYICMAKTQYSLSDNPKLLGSPEDFTVNIKSVKIAAGSGFLIPVLGDIMVMPGLPEVPAAENITLSDDGEISGLS